MEQNKIPWPGNKDKIFSEGIYGPSLAYLEYLKHHGNDTLLANAFKESADMIFTQIEMKQIYKHPDIYFFPIVYLYRHSIELHLKQIIRYGINLQILQENDKTIKLMGEHKLLPLWEKTRIVLEEVWPDGNKNDLKNVGRLINEFHNIDPIGQNLRYFKDKTGKPTTKKLPKSVDLKSLRNTCNGLFNFFLGCDAGLSETVDVQNDMRSYYS